MRLNGVGVFLGVHWTAQCLLYPAPGARVQFLPTATVQNAAPLFAHFREISPRGVSAANPHRIGLNLTYDYLMKLVSNLTNTLQLLNKQLNNFTFYNFQT